jgi:glutamyl-tRNA(Gln) amidotransferase subunit E
VSVEEDACREVSDRGHTIIFRTDRLSMPLVEIVTAPELRCPSEVGQAAQVLGDLMRVTGKVRRGLGATRQDVNVSVTGGTRVEIKGVPRIKMIPHLVRNEALRQRALLTLRERFGAVTSGSAEPMMRHCEDIVVDGRNPVLTEAVRRGDAVMAVKIPNGRAIVDAPTQPGRTFAHELAERVRVIACVQEPPYCYCGPDASLLTRRRWKLIRHRVRTKKADAVVVCWGKQEDVETALREVLIRFAEALQGVPNETRQARPHGITDFERILPGADRMYPDTDSPPTAISDERIEALRAALPEPPWERERRLREARVPETLINGLAIGPRYALARRLVEAGVDGRLVGHLLGNLLRWFSRLGEPVAELSDETLEALATRVHEGLLQREGLTRVLRELLHRLREGAAAPPVPALCEELGLAPLSEDPAVVIRAALQQAPATRSAKVDARLRHAMAVAMGPCRGRAPGRQVREVVTAILKGGPHVG